MLKRRANCGRSSKVFRIGSRRWKSIPIARKRSKMARPSRRTRRKRRARFRNSLESGLLPTIRGWWSTRSGENRGCIRRVMAEKNPMTNGTIICSRNSRAFQTQRGRRGSFAARPCTGTVSPFSKRWELSKDRSFSSRVGPAVLDTILYFYRSVTLGRWPNFLRRKNIRSATGGNPWPRFVGS